MKSVVERRTKKFDIFRELNEKKHAILKEEVLLRKIAAKDKQITNAREFFAASKIAALIRGYLDRLLCNRLKKRLRAIRTIQRIILGKIGRLRWKREYWRSVSVVKSDSALQEILSRSTSLRTAVLAGHKGYSWEELFDPLTNSFWYFNKITKQNTWHCPLVFQKVLICSWEGFHAFGGMPHQKPCRCVFGTVEEYQGHMRTAHNWYCLACGERNPGSGFPNCHLCGNKFNADGVDGEKVLHSQVEKVRRKLATFLQKDVDERDAGLYSIKGRMVELATERRIMKEHMTALATAAAENPDSVLSAKQLAKQTALNDIYQRQLKETYHSREDRMTSVANKLSEDMFLADNEENDTIADQMKLFQRLTATAAAPATTPSSPSKPSKASAKRPVIDTPVLYSPEQPGFEVPAEVFRSVTAASDAKEFSSKGGMEGERERFRDPTTRAVFSEQEFDLLASIHNEDLDSAMRLDLCSDDEDDDESTLLSVENHADILDSMHPEGAGASSTVEGVTARREADKKMKIAVCERYLLGECSLTTCSKAHPGIRDSAKPKLKASHAENGEIVRIPFVTLCPRSNGIDNSCPNGKACRKYHVYMRPSTQEIVRALYPLVKGVRTKTMADGTTISGNVADDQFNGYAVMTWRDGSTYWGDWQDGLRHGVGIHRTGYSSPCGEGIEYVGAYKAGRRHGWGMLTNANGDEYLGEWHSGKMEGVGVVRSNNGDTYQGMISKGLYSGIGTFTRGATGDVYMGHCREGKAWGLGVLSMSSGEKYKGYFDRNTRHGKGACAYPDGCRYAGEWYRGCYQGFGVFLSPRGEKYVGQWAGGKKHGQGRYMFASGDFYDGQFVKDKAQGQGVYYHVNGNIYSGQWVADRRNGKGTYIFANGSKYTGHWTENNMHVKGRFDFANGSFYRGQFDSNTKHGRGTFTWPNHNEYTGDFLHEKMCGIGEMRYFTGHRYVGQWANNKKHGQGVMYYSTGPVYDGQWVADIRQGRGRITFMPGSQVEEAYEGEWMDDNWHGQGTYWYRKDEGTVYEGEWVMGVRHGQGKISYKDGSYYRGDFHKDQMWGKGVYVGADGSQYDGEWRANMRQGIGTSIGSDGCIYHGEYWGNMKQGKGKLLRVDGSVYHGTWEANTVVGLGSVTFPVGDKSKNDGLPKQITMKVFGY